ncbi:hypothetical protein HY065_03110 [Candidatus Berkelbacteria bacterium]|nr:hypothetical protein [Candidatus Berkelbacteria bacterium]
MQRTYSQKGFGQVAMVVGGAIVFIAVAVAVYWYITTNRSGGTTGVSTKTYQTTTPATTSTTSTDTQSLTTIDAQIKSFDSATASADQGLNDKPGDLSSQ